MFGICLVSLWYLFGICLVSYQRDTKGIPKGYQRDTKGKNYENIDFWGRLGAVLKASWCTTWPQLGSQNGAKYDKKSMQKKVKF